MATIRPSSVLPLLLGCVAYTAQKSTQPTAHGIIVSWGSGRTAASVELAVAGESAFRVSLASGGALPKAIESPMIATQTKFAAFTQVKDGSRIGIKTSFGSLLVDSSSGALFLMDSAGKTITNTSNGFGTHSTYVDALGYHHKPFVQDRKDTCAGAKNNYSTASIGGRTPKYKNGLFATSQQDCCSACNGDSNCTAWVYVTNGKPDGSGMNCWPLSFSNAIKPAADRTFGGVTTPAPAPPPAPGMVSLSFASSSNMRLYGSGSGKTSARTLSRYGSSPHVKNTETFVPYYYSTDGYSALGVSAFMDNPKQLGSFPASYKLNGQTSINWNIMAGTAGGGGGGAGAMHADMYLMLAASLKEGTSAYYALTGPIAMLPRYSFGFMACRWGWKDEAYIWSTLSQFRNGSFPIDAWISDFEWFTNTPDYTLKSAGEPDYMDFGYNNITFPEPTQQLQDYRSKLNLRFGGIRKPRLGNSELLVMARSKGWTVGQGSGGGAGGSRNLNYTNPDVVDWYSEQQAHYLTDGVEFLWNDEGETQYFTFHFWNYAEQLTLKASPNPTKRFFTINRAFTPGLQRMGAMTWTGDISSSWDDLGNTPGMMLNWGLAGSPIVTCDIGGFNEKTPTSHENALLLTRWYQLGVFLPVMRVHSTRYATPHFPFLWGDEAADSMRKSLELRYRMLPTHYSLAHEMYATGVPAMRSLLMEYPTDAAVAEMTSEWLMGDSILAAPVLSEDNSTSPYLPAGVWFEFNTTMSHKGPTTLTLPKVPLDHIPIYVKAGGIVALAPLVQYTDALPGTGPLSIQVYAGADGSFDLVEDDGETTDYATEAATATRITSFRWSDAAKTLSWTTNGTYAGNKTFVQLSATLFSPDTSASSSAPPKALGGSGSVSF